MIILFSYETRYVNRKKVCCGDLGCSKCGGSGNVLKRLNVVFVKKNNVFQTLF